MSFFVDTNVLLRLADEHSAENPMANSALESLLARNETVFISVQVLVEFWSVATRPESVNGLGWTAPIVADAVTFLRRQFPLLPEKPEVVDRWYLVSRCRISGKHAHDARLAALMIVHHVPQVLTFNTSDFPDAWGVHAIHPRTLTSGH